MAEGSTKGRLDAGRFSPTGRSAAGRRRRHRRAAASSSRCSERAQAPVARVAVPGVRLAGIARQVVELACAALPLDPQVAARCGSPGSAGRGGCVGRRRGRCPRARGPRGGPRGASAAAGRARTGRIERPSTGMSATAPLASSSVGARSVLATSSLETVPGAIPGPADQQRHARGGVVGQVLALDDPVLALEEAVVGGEEDVGRGEPAGARERADDVGDRLVDGEQRLAARAEVGAHAGRRRRVGAVQAADVGGLVADVALAPEGGAAGAAWRSGRRAAAPGGRRAGSCCRASRPRRAGRRTSATGRAACPGPVPSIASTAFRRSTSVW